MVNMLDEVAWLFNLRGSDIDFNPGAFACHAYTFLRSTSNNMLPIVFFAYALIDADKTLLFVNESQFDESVRAHLGPEIEIHPYDTFFAYLTHLGAELKESTNTVRSSPPAPPLH